MRNASFTMKIQPDSPKPNPASTAGFTLVEVIIATALFTFMALGISRMTLTSFEISNLNVNKTTAMSVAQGYIEQIKSLDNESITRLSTFEAELPLDVSQVVPTRSVSLLSAGATIDEIDDWLVVNTLDPDTLSDSLDVVNFKQVIVDIDQDTGNAKTMDMWFDVEIHRLTDLPGDVYLIDLQYIYSMPGLRSGTTLTREAFIRRNSRDYIKANRTIQFRNNANEGRLQLVTTLLNFQSI